MDWKNKIYVDNDKTIQLNEVEVVTRRYSNLLKNEYIDDIIYCTRERADDLEVNYFPKHQLIEFISDMLLDLSDVAWMQGIKLRTNDQELELQQIYDCGCIEVYEASLQENQQSRILELEAEIVKLKLGIE